MRTRCRCASRRPIVSWYSVAELLVVLLIPPPVLNATVEAQIVMSAGNREKACGSYVLPLLEAAGLIEIERTRPAKARAKQATASGA